MEEKLTQEIEKLRKKMVAHGMKLGLQHPLVLAYSRRIDALHNQLLYCQGLRLPAKLSLA